MHYEMEEIHFVNLKNFMMFYNAIETKFSR